MSNAITLRRLDDADVVLLASWLAQNYVLKWYYDADAWLDEVNARHSRFSWIHHYIVMDGETAIGFCQYYDCYDARSFEDWYRVNRRGETFSIDYLIGDARYLGKGYGKQIVRLLTETVKVNENAVQVIAQPEPENLASVHVLLTNGYTYDHAQGYYCKVLSHTSAPQ